MLANKQRYDERRCVVTARLSALLAQFADNPTLRCGEAKCSPRNGAAGGSTIPLSMRRHHAERAGGGTGGETPDAPALADGRWQFSYREMRQQVVALAAGARGVKPGDSVAVALPRSVFLTLALHGIVEAGAAWLPLDTGYPDDRLRMMLEDARPSLLITSDDQRARFSDIPAWKACATAAAGGGGCRAAGALTAGAYRLHHLYLRLHRAPKGVMVGQTAIVNRLLWMQDHYPLRDGGAENAVQL
jgi:enterobactin synthetase component F